MNRRNREIPDRVEFRWRQHEEEFARRLAESAEKAGRSESDHARELMKDALTSSEQLQHHLYTLQHEVAQLRSQFQQLGTIGEGLRAIHENVYEFRDELLTCVAKILADAGRMEATAAQAWVEDMVDTN